MSRQSRQTAREEVDRRYVSETFLDLDSRTDGRRIRILEPVRSWPHVVTTFKTLTRYRYIVITNEGNPATVGRHGRISARTLDKRYRKVSH